MTEEEKQSEKVAIEPRRRHRLSRPLSLMPDIDRMWDDIRRSFEDLLWYSRRPGMLERELESSPLMDIEDNGKEYRITAELPGLKKEDINIEVTPDSIEISAESSDKTEEESKNFLRRERHYSKYYRCLELPEEIKAEEAEATMENGVLDVVLPKRGGKALKKLKFR